MGIVATETYLLGKGINAMVTLQNPCEVVTSIFSFAAVLLLIVTSIVIIKKLSKKKTIDRWLNWFSILYIALIVGISLINGYEKLFLDSDSLYAAAMMTAQYLLLINAPLVVYVLISRAGEAKLIKSSYSSQ